jgi:hypothetical protein
MMNSRFGLPPGWKAAGYNVFADILTLEPGDRWRKEITNTLQTRAIKIVAEVPSQLGKSRNA